jgi:geranylgeranyl reductase
VAARAGHRVRRRAAHGLLRHIERERDGGAVVVYREEGSRSGEERRVRARFVIGADGALSAVARQEIPGADKVRHVFAYHEIVEAPASEVHANYEATRCDVYYEGTYSPDFYAWVFPHGDVCSVGTGTFQKGFDMRGAITELRRRTGLGDVRTLKREGAPIPLTPLSRWDNGRDVVVAGDAAGIVAPASGEGIFYAMTGGRRAAEAVELAIRTGQPEGAAHRAAALHVGARAGVLRAQRHAVVLVPQRRPTRALRGDLRGSRRAAAHLRRLHAQEARACAADVAFPHLHEELGPSQWPRVRLSR